MQSSASLDRLEQINYNAGEPDAAGIVHGPDPVLAWQALVRYIIKFCSSESFMSISISVLVNEKVPMAWRVSGHQLSPFYAEVPDSDPQKQWLGFTRHLISRCYRNNGFAVVDAENVIIHEGRPIVWIEAGVKLIYPMSILGSDNVVEEIICRHLYPQYVRNDTSI